MDRNDLEVGALFTTDGEDLWELVSYCLDPTCSLKKILPDGVCVTGTVFKPQVEEFGLGGITAQKFTRVTMETKK